VRVHNVQSPAPAAEALRVGEVATGQPFAHPVADTAEDLRSLPVRGDGGGERAEMLIRDAQIGQAARLPVVIAQLAADRKALLKQGDRFGEALLVHEPRPGC
jgi:hypothetical protein